MSEPSKAEQLGAIQVLETAQLLSVEQAEELRRRVVQISQNVGMELRDNLAILDQPISVLDIGEKSQHNIRRVAAKLGKPITTLQELLQITSTQFLGVFRCGPGSLKEINSELLAKTGKQIV